MTSTPSISTPRSSPHAIASRSVSSAAGGPSVSTRARCRRARRRASTRLRHRAAAVRRSSRARGRRGTRRPSGPSSMASNVGICLTSAAIARLMAASSLSVGLARSLTTVSGCRDRWRGPDGSPRSRHRRHRAHADRQAQGRARGVAPDRPARLHDARRCSSASTSIPGSSTTSSAGASPRSGEQGCNVTRNAWVAAGLPWHVPATSVDRQCGSSQQAMHFVAQGVIAGAYDLAIACGVESMTRAPMSTNARGGVGPFSPEFLAPHGQHARHPVLGRAGARRPVRRDARGDGRVRAREPPPRRREHRLRVLRPRDPAGADQGPRDGRAHRRGAEADEGIRPRRRRWSRSARCRPAWESDDQPAPDITAGNASQMSDGASAMLIADRATAERARPPDPGPVRALRRRGRRSRCSCSRRRTR